MGTLYGVNQIVSNIYHYNEPYQQKLQGGDVVLYKGKALSTTISVADKIGYVLFTVSLPAFVWWGFAL